MSDDAKRIPNIDFIGRCYDIVRTDPLNLADSALPRNAIDINMNVPDKVEKTPDGSYLVPTGVHYSGIFAFSWESQSGVISSTHEFQEEFKFAVEAEAGVQGGFEFSASASHSEAVRRTESRKQSFVYSRAYRVICGLELQLGDDDFPLTVTKQLASAVQKLPIGDYSEVGTSYQGFIGDFGTHFTRDIKLGGLAFQVVSGSSKRFLASKQSEDELKAKAGVEIEAIKGGASAQEAQKIATTSDQESSLERTKLDFRGGDGSTTSIDSSWITSLYDHPVIVKAKMEPLTSLFTTRFFPNEVNIEDKGMLLELATRDWVVSKGQPSDSSAPIRYGEAMVFMLPWNDNTTIQPAILGSVLPAPTGPGSGYNPDFEYPVGFAFPLDQQGQPVLEGEIAAVRLESTDARRAGATVLAGDKVRIRLIREGGKTQTYLGPDLNSASTVERAGAFTIVIQGDNPTSPDRLGDFLLESDKLLFMTGDAGSPGQFFDIVTGNRSMALGFAHVGFSLRRCGDPQL